MARRGCAPTYGTQSFSADSIYFVLVASPLLSNCWTGCPRLAAVSSSRHFASPQSFSTGLSRVFDSFGCRNLAGVAWLTRLKSLLGHCRAKLSSLATLFAFFLFLRFLGFERIRALEFDTDGPSAKLVATFCCFLKCRVGAFNDGPQSQIKHLKSVFISVLSPTTSTQALAKPAALIPSTGSSINCLSATWATSTFVPSLYLFSWLKQCGSDCFRLYQGLGSHSTKVT